MRIHTGTLVAGLVYLIIGVVFVFEALGQWTMSLADLRYVVPLGMVAAGLAVVVGSLSREYREHH